MGEAEAQGFKECSVSLSLYRGIKSFGMVLAASNPEHTQVEPLCPPSGAKPGDRIFSGISSEQVGQIDHTSPSWSETYSSSTLFIYLDAVILLHKCNESASAISQAIQSTGSIFLAFD